MALGGGSLVPHGSLGHIAAGAGVPFDTDCTVIPLNTGFLFVRFVTDCVVVHFEANGVGVSFEAEARASCLRPMKGASGLRPMTSASGLRPLPMAHTPHPCPSTPCSRPLAQGRSPKAACPRPCTPHQWAIAQGPPRNMTPKAQHHTPPTSDTEKIFTWLMRNHR